MCPNCASTVPQIKLPPFCPKIVPQLCPNRAPTVPQLCPNWLCLNCAPSNFMPQLCPDCAREFSILCPKCASTVPQVCLVRLPSCPKSLRLKKSYLLELASVWAFHVPVSCNRLISPKLPENSLSSAPWRMQVANSTFEPIAGCFCVITRVRYCCTMEYYLLIPLRNQCMITFELGV